MNSTNSSTRTENNVIIIAACIPTLRPIYTKFFGNGPRSSNPGYKGSGPYPRKCHSASVYDDHRIRILGHDIEPKGHLAGSDKDGGDEVTLPMNKIRKTTEVNVKVGSPSLHAPDAGIGTNLSSPYPVYAEDRV